MNIQSEAFYKLSKYKIIEAVGGGLWWESHHGMSECQTGRCFVEGSILIIGPIESERPGFFKREFVEHLNRLPSWRKTKYFCLSRSIYPCKTSTRLSPISKTEMRMAVKCDSPKYKAIGGMSKNINSQIKNVDYKQHCSSLKLRLIGGWKLVKRWIYLMQRSS